MLLPICGGGCGGGFGCVGSFVDSVRVCIASLSARVGGGHGPGGRAAVFRLFSPGTPPFWPNLLDKLLMLLMTKSGGIGNGSLGSVFQLGTFTIKPVIVFLVPPPF